MRPTSAAVPSKPSRSFSKISTPPYPAAAMAASFRSKVPLIETVAMEVSMQEKWLTSAAKSKTITRAAYTLVLYYRDVEFQAYRGLQGDHADAHHERGGANAWRVAAGLEPHDQAS